MATNKKPKFKLSQLAAAPAEIELVHPIVEFNDPETGNTGYAVKIAGPHSLEYRKAQEKYFESNRTYEDQSELVSSVFLGWTGFDEEFSKEAVLAFVSDEGNRWALTQIQEFATNPANFYKKK